MNGRMEHEMKVTEYINNRIKNYPAYVRDYDRNMDGEGKTYNTRKGYINVLLRYLDYLKAEGYDIDNVETFKKINTVKVKAYFSHIRKVKTKDGWREASGSYINMNQRALSNFFMFLVEDEVLEKTPFRIDGQSITIKKKKDRHAQVALDTSEVNKMYDNIENGVGNKIAKGKQRNWKERDMAMIDLVLNSGLRVSALTEINVEDIDLRNLTIHVIEKGNNDRLVKIDRECADKIRDWIAKRAELLGEKETNALFISNRRERITQDGVAKIVKKYSSGINKHISPHKLRSTFATNAYQATKDIQGVSSALGHGSVSITQRYLVESADEEAEIANAVRNRYKNQY